jgi:hypothetical protein
VCCFRGDIVARNDDERGCGVDAKTAQTPHDGPETVEAAARVGWPSPGGGGRGQRVSARDVGSAGKQEPAQGEQPWLRHRGLSWALVCAMYTQSPATQQVAGRAPRMRIQLTKEVSGEVASNKGVVDGRSSVSRAVLPLGQTCHTRREKQARSAVQLRTKKGWGVGWCRDDAEQMGWYFAAN